MDEARDELVALPGVGRKTAACVLLFAYGMRDIPVDTHVCRVGTRLGLFREGAPFEELHDAMLELTPRGQELEFHVNLLRTAGGRVIQGALNVRSAPFYGCALPATICAKQTEIFKRS